MPAPTALQRRPEGPIPNEVTAVSDTIQENLVIDTQTPSSAASNPTTYTPSQAAESMTVDLEGRPHFAPEATTKQILRAETRKIAIPPHRMTPLRSAWPKIYPPLVTHLSLSVRMNTKQKSVELRTNRQTASAGALQKGEDFVRAFTLGFEVEDAIALLRLDDLYIETFEIKDVKTLQGEHLGRAIGRIAGKDGKTRFAIENASRTRVVLADSKIHILGGFQNIHIAREAIVSLILGSPPGKVYGNLRTVAARMKERF